KGAMYEKEKQDTLFVIIAFWPIHVGLIISPDLEYLIYLDKWWCHISMFYLPRWWCHIFVGIGVKILNGLHVGMDTISNFTQEVNWLEF
ncbi:hypothetical protein ACJX0J_021219, partial [Zea mays]